VFNIGSGIGHAVSEMVEIVQKVAGTAKPVREDGQRVRPAASEVGALVCSYEKSQLAFGYEPKVGLEEGLAHLRDYLAANWRADAVAYRI
jgi:nucleoside-diphosphate-sugar epimerase